MPQMIFGISCAANHVNNEYEHHPHMTKNERKKERHNDKNSNKSKRNRGV